MAQNQTYYFDVPHGRENAATYTTGNATYRYVDDVAAATLFPPSNSAAYTLTLGSTEQEKGNKQMSRALYEVTVVDPELGIVVHEEQVVASNDTNARIKALRALEGDVDTFDIAVRKIMDVRPKAEKAA
jgi:hypothetical protein